MSLSTQRIATSRERLRLAMTPPPTPAVLGPVAEQHPWLLVLGGAVLGGALTQRRPGRWRLRSPAAC